MEAEANKGAKADPIRIEMLRNQARIASEGAKHTYQPNEYARILEENGATNRSVLASFDSTSFSYSLPSNRTELWFLMESQRLLHPVFRDFYQERDAQADEDRKQAEGNAQGRLFGNFLAAAFKAHPYRNPVDGWLGDIQGLRRATAREFFDRYYVPGNITMAIVGDVNPVEAKRMAERYFGPMVAKPLPPDRHTEEPQQDGPKTVVVEAAGPPLLVVGYKRPSQFDRDDLALDLFQFLMSQGNTGILSREMVKDKRLALQARAGATFPSGRYPNLLVFFIVPAQGRTIEENQRGLDELLQRFKTVPIDPQNLARAKAQLRATFMRRVATNEQMANLMADYAANYGDWRKMFTSLDDINKVTTENVQRAVEKYIVATGVTIAFTVQPGQSNLPPPAPRTPPERKTGGLQ